MKSILVPLDNRPVTYLLPRLVAGIAGINAVLPPRHLMGTLQRPANTASLNDWLESSLTSERPQALLVCLDSLLYGGLIPSRRSEEPASEIHKRVEAAARWKRAHGLRTVLAQSSILRISDSYDNSEEKEYWNRFGREIFAWSELLHKVQRGDTVASAALKIAESKIPPAIRDDYLKTRMRNFQANRLWLNFVKSGAIDFLAFSQDDSGEFGLNVVERDKLMAQARTDGVSDRVMAYAGADEVLLSLLARLLVSQAGKTPRARLSFIPEHGANIPSRYEGQSMGSSVRNQAQAAGVELLSGASQPADFEIVMHTSADRQGDHILLAGQPDLRALNTRRTVEETIRRLQQSELPCVLCDVAYANGSDPDLVQALFDKPDLLQKLWGYAGWNTTGNTVGSALSMAVARWYAGLEKRQSAAERALKQCIFVRLADDWAFQTRVRKELSGPIQPAELAQLMTPHFSTIGHALGYQPDFLKLGLPWHRTFEIEIDVEQPVGIGG